MKAKSLIGLSIALRDNFDGEVPGRLEDLVTLPGVGRKTANVVLGNVFGVPGITVDTHFGRLARRFGWTTEEDPVVVEAVVAEIFPKSEWTMLSHRVVFHGRRICHSRKPASASGAVISSAQPPPSAVPGPAGAVYSGSRSSPRRTARGSSVTTRPGTV